MTTLQDRVAAIAKRASRADTNIERQIAREWWTVKRGGEEFEVFMCPPASAEEMAARYPGAGILPR